MEIFKELNISTIEFINLSSIDSFEYENKYKFDLKNETYIYKETSYYVCVPKGQQPKIKHYLNEGKIKDITSQIYNDLSHSEYDIVVIFNNNTTLIYSSEDGSWIFNKEMSRKEAAKIVNKFAQVLISNGFKNLKNNTLGIDVAK